MAHCREESGSCYALDIGGTNFRVAYYKLSDKHGKVVSYTQVASFPSKKHNLSGGYRLQRISIKHKHIVVSNDSRGMT